MRPRIVALLNEMLQTGLFGWLVPTPNLMYGAAALAAALVFYLLSRRIGVSAAVVWTCIWLGTAGAFVGAKMLYVLLHLKSYLLMPSHIFAAGGTVSFGAYLGAIISITIYLKIREEPMLKYLDLLAVSLPVGTILGRFSCFLNGDDFGKLTHAFWGVRYPQDSYPFMEQVSRGLMSPTAPLSLPVHPNQLYLALNALLIFIIVSRIWKGYRNYPGVTLSMYAILYTVTRFAIEFFRDEPPLWSSGLIFSQWVCLALLSISILMAIYFFKKYHLSKYLTHKSLSPITEGM